MKVTIKQIAEIAGVHRATVDKVLHNRPGVSDEVRERIQTIIDELDYKPNVIGKALARQNRPVRIAVVLLHVDSLTNLKEGVEKAIAEFSTFGVEITYYYAGGSDVSEESAVLNTIADNAYDGLIVQPINHDIVRDKINELTNNGMPVVTVNTDLSNSKRLCFVGQDMNKAGRVAGELMGQLLNGIGEVAIVTSSETLLSSRERENGFEKLIGERYSKIKIVDVVHTHEEKQRTFINTLQMLKKSPDLSGIYITCGNVEYVGKAVRMDGKHEKIKIISHDVYPEIAELIKSGVINFSLDQNLQGQGYGAVKVLFDKLFSSVTPRDEALYFPVDIRIRENIDA